MWRLERVAAASGREVFVVATVQGLVAEAERVRAAYAKVRPAVVALGVSPEATEALVGYVPDPEVDPFEDLADVDYIYSVRLAEFGDVALPPPCLREAARLAMGDGVPVRGVDMPEDVYDDAFTKAVSVWGFLKYGRIQKRLAKRPPKAPGPREFALEWDRRMRKVKGLARVEAMRERHMADALLALAAEAHGPVLLVVDVPRSPGVQAALAAPDTG